MVQMSCTAILPEYLFAVQTRVVGAGRRLVFLDESFRFDALHLSEGEANAAPDVMRPQFSGVPPPSQCHRRDAPAGGQLFRSQEYARQ